MKNVWKRCVAFNFRKRIKTPTTPNIPASDRKIPLHPASGKWRECVCTGFHVMAVSFSATASNAVPHESDDRPRGQAGAVVAVNAARIERLRPLDPSSAIHRPESRADLPFRSPRDLPALNLSFRTPQG
jgi:hypothetical protein